MPNLFDSPPPRPNFPLSRQSLEGIGTIEVPGGPAWERQGKVFFNPALGMSLLIQTQINGFSGKEQVYLESYNEVNIRDAPEWERGPEQLGQLAGLPAARTSGRFDNGTPMVTRDYLFFAPFTTVLLQSRVPAEHAEALALTDYLASTFRR
ncbi:MAG: hypothetical protein EOO36_08110 [Cytophagaceae bacterium]|nr:MAG: hypothetical protein EOO36_08110 [Cytophagaceae bacterium]